MAHQAHHSSKRRLTSGSDPLEETGRREIDQSIHWARDASYYINHTSILRHIYIYIYILLCVSLSLSLSTHLRAWRSPRHSAGCGRLEVREPEEAGSADAPVQPCGRPRAAVLDGDWLGS